MPKKGILAEKGPKRHFLAKIPKKRDFRGFLAPSGPPRALQRGCFYINPSRRGPVALRRVLESQGRPGPGERPD